MTEEKSRILEILKEQHQKNIDEFVKSYESDSEIKAVGNFQDPTFEVRILT